MEVPEICKQNKETGSSTQVRWTMDSKSLLGIFPTEIWLQITGNITDCETLENVSNSVLYFRDLLLSHRVNFLFPKMFTIFAHEKRKYSTRLGRSRQTGRDSKLIRLVSKTWCSGVDDFYTNNPVSGMAISLHADLQMPGKCIHHFEKTHKGTTRSPFIGAALFLQFSPDSTRFLNLLFPFLARYGQHVRNCKIKCRGTSGQVSRFYGHLEVILSFMPGLKMLDISYDQGGGRVLRNNQIVNDFQLHHTLDSLTDLRSNGILPGILKKLILPSSKILSKLSLDHVDDGVSYGDLFNVEIPNLRELFLKVNSLKDFENLDKSPVKWPLNKLSLIFCEWSRCPFIHWSRVCQMLERKWADTLTRLELEFPNPRRAHEESLMMRECGGMLRLNLPHLESLVLNASIYASLDFILPMVNTLKYLEVIISCNFNRWRRIPLGYLVEKGQIIQFIGYFGAGMGVRRLLKSNIWTLFPRLEEFRIDGKFKKSRWRGGENGVDWLEYGGLLRRSNGNQINMIRLENPMEIIAPFRE